MRIILANENRGWGGAEEHTLRLAEGLAARGHDVLLVASPGSVLADAVDGSRIAIRRVRMRNDVDLLAVGALAALIRGHHADVVHTIGARDHLLASMAARLTRIPVIKAEHTYLADTSSGLCLRAYRYWTDRVVCVCDAMRGHLNGLGIPDGRIETITNGLDTDHYTGATRERNGAPVIAVVASCIPGKGHGILVRTITLLTARYPDLRVVCAGGGPLKEHLIAVASAAGAAQHFTWLGHVDDVRPVLASADMLVHPSLSEALPYAIMEAMAAGLPVVAAEVGGVAELVVDGVTGLLVRPGDEQGLAAAVSRMLDDQLLRRSAGEAGRRRVMERFTMDRMVSDYERLYDEVRA